MRWTERQRQLLAAMGSRPWPQPPAPTAPPPPAAPPAAPRTATRVTTAPTPAPVRPPRPAAPLPPSPAPIAQAAAAPVPSVALDWPELQAAVASCRACGLCETRRQTVFGVGSRQAQLMLVGEAPGEQEDARGEPFVGAAGQLLDRILAALGTSRAETYIANTLKCRPPRNRNPQPEELARCAPFLDRQIELVQPRAIVAMGRCAIDHLLGSDAPIGRLRGEVHRWRGVPVVVTYHPAYLLRQPSDKAKAWADWCLARSLIA